MTWRQHRDMLMHSAKLVLVSITLIILAAFMFFLMILASAGYGQWNVEQNMIRQEVIQNVKSKNGQ